MIKKALLAGLKDRIINGEELYGLDDQGLFKLMEEKKHPLFCLAGNVKNGTLFSEAAAVHFDEKTHAPLVDITTRYRYEEALAAELSHVTGKTFKPDELIIDLPEPVSLESTLYVQDENCAFSQSSSAFGEKTVAAFVTSLRIIRIFTADKTKIPESILQNNQRWLHL
jgi:hypothetical protein